MSIIEELCVFFNTISGISQLHVNNKGCFDTPSILISIRQHFLKHPDLALKRIAERVRAGGHDVPPEVVRKVVLFAS
ncbi:MAG: hypothetical protein KKH02_14040 [Proteobacteria bacterium]|nr:hypothetical protein [Pseudomonadota bacterium]